MTRLLPSVLAGCALLAACRPAPSEQVTLTLDRPVKGTPVATFRGGAITLEDLDRQLAALPPLVRMRFQGAAQKKDYVEGQVRVELLSREAIRRGLQNDPDFLDTVKKVLAQKALQQELEQSAPQPTDSEIQAWYDGHTADYARPELVQVQDLFLSADAHGDDARREAQRTKAERLRAQAAKLKPDAEAAFAELVRANSDDLLTKPAGGDLRPLPLGDLQARYGAEVSTAAAALTAPGAVSPVVATERGFHVLRLKARTPARTQPLAEVKSQIRNRLFTERRNASSEALLARLKKERGYQLDEAALARVNAGAAPSTAGGTPGSVAVDPTSGAARTLAPPALRPPSTPAPAAPR